MRLTVFLETQFYKTPDEKVWHEIGPDIVFWQRYLGVFDSVEVVARVQRVNNVPLSYKRSDSNSVSFVSLPCYVGPLQFLLHSKAISLILKSVIRGADAVLLRNGQVSNCAFKHLKINCHPFGIEVVGDPYEVFAPGSVDHPLRPFFRWWLTSQLKKQCNSAVGAAYVTEHALQNRYPNPFYTNYYSSIDINEKDYVKSHRVEFGESGVFNLVLIGSLSQLYKSPDILIDAVALCRTKGHKLKLNIIGDGKFRPQLEEQVARLGLNDSVVFMGQLPAGAAVRDELLKADLFILPSRTEGLPRAMIEAMACGLPCIGSDVGGIPELLHADDLVPSGSVQALADKIEEIITNPERMQAMSSRNLEKSAEFKNDILEHRRREFYSYLKEKTTFWLEDKRSL
jgi:glycosyltransferase involved in cell wall biosynthesis